MEPDRLSREMEILELVGLRNKICRQLFEKIVEDRKAGLISHEEAIARHNDVLKELEITQGILDRHKTRINATKTEKKD